jgi:hypothetical protein
MRHYPYPHVIYIPCVIEHDWNGLGGSKQEAGTGGGSTLDYLSLRTKISTGGMKKSQGEVGGKH